ncbi:MAG TPA: glycosyltransferase [Actinomycetota bacterium]|nr:glycosyltransferase [Actinomycetota bacterium]
MKVLFVSHRWDYQQPSRGDSFEYTNFWDSLRQIPGVEAEHFPSDILEADRGREQMNSELLQRVRAWKPDLVFFFFFADEFTYEVVSEISSLTTTVNWFADDQWRFHTYSTKWAPHLTWVATTYGPAAEEFRRGGQAGVIETQWGCNHFLYRPLAVPRDLDVTFIGQPHGGRPRIINALREVGIDVKTWGHGWPSGRIKQQEMIEVFSRSKVNLNLSNASQRLGPRAGASLLVQRKGRWLVPNLRSLPARATEMWAKRRDQIKGRNFEIPGCRTFLLTSEVPGLDKWFEFDQEIAVFSNTTELIERARHYLANPAEREEVALAAYERTLAEHTYVKRFTDMFSAMGFRL